MPDTEPHSLVEIYRGQKILVEISSNGIVALDNYWQPIRSHNIEIYLNNRKVTAEIKRRAEMEFWPEHDTICEIYRDIVRQMIDEWLFGS